MTPRCGRLLRTGNVCSMQAGHSGEHNGTSLAIKNARSRSNVAKKVYAKSIKGLAISKAWRDSPEGRAATDAYQASPKGRAAKKAYAKSTEGYAAQKTYAESPKGRTAHKVKEHKRRAQKRGTAVEPFTLSELASHIEAVGGRCVYCNGPYEHLDHVYPLSKGGPHALSNLVPACATCNLRKGDMLPLQWLLNTDRRAP